MKSDKQKGFRASLKSTLKTVEFFPSCKNEIRVNFFNMIFCNTAKYFYAGRTFVQLQFCWDKADKLQVMFYFPEIK